MAFYKLIAATTLLYSLNTLASGQSLEQFCHAQSGQLKTAVTVQNYNATNIGWLTVRLSDSDSVWYHIFPEDKPLIDYARVSYLVGVYVDACIGPENRLTGMERTIGTN